MICRNANSEKGSPEKFRLRIDLFCTFGEQFVCHEEEVGSMINDLNRFWNPN